MQLTHQSCERGMQGSDGHLNPIPPEDDFDMPRTGEEDGRAAPVDPNLQAIARILAEFQPDFSRMTVCHEPLSRRVQLTGPRSVSHMITNKRICRGRM